MSVSDGVFRLRQSSHINTSTHALSFAVLNGTDYITFAISDGPIASLLNVELELCAVNGQKDLLLANIAHSAVPAYELSGHIMDRHISENYPVLQVFYTSFFKSTDLENVVLYHEQQRSFNSSDSLSSCIVTVVKWNAQWLTSYCIVDSSHLNCVTETILPSEWFYSSHKASVSYFVKSYPYQHGNELLCRNMSNSLHVSLNEKASVDDNFSNGRCLGEIILEDNLSSLRTINAGDLLLQVPEISVIAGSRFILPVKLQAGSALRSFSMRQEHLNFVQ